MRPQNVICSKVYPGNWFTWEGNHGSIEISTLSGHCPDPFCQVYNDACDEGLGVRGRTKEVVFAVDTVMRSREGEIEGWQLKSISEKGYRLTIFND